MGSFCQRESGITRFDRTWQSKSSVEFAVLVRGDGPGAPLPRREGRRGESRRGSSAPSGFGRPRSASVRPARVRTGRVRPRGLAATTSPEGAVRRPRGWETGGVVPLGHCGPFGAGPRSQPRPTLTPRAPGTARVGPRHRSGRAPGTDRVEPRLGSARWKGVLAGMGRRELGSPRHDPGRNGRCAATMGLSPMRSVRLSAAHLLTGRSRGALAGRGRAGSRPALILGSSALGRPDRRAQADLNSQYCSSHSIGRR